MVEGRIRTASETRGFAQSRLLTHWEEVAGPELAAIARPVKVSYGRGNFGAELVLLTTGANAPVVEMRREELRKRINAVYGYDAIRRLRITQTAPTGFSEGQVDFTHRKKQMGPRAPSPRACEKAKTVATDIADPTLRQALERLAANIISKSERDGR
nr:DciA family protein [Cognatishimia sp. F0-27]